MKVRVMKIGKIKVVMKISPTRYLFPSSFTGLKTIGRKYANSVNRMVGIISGCKSTEITSERPL
jgi:hypothetical protein